VFSAVTTSLFVCVVKLFIWYMAVRYLCVCVPDYLSVGCLVVSSQPNIPQARTHIDNVQPHTK
jgi:hypothetical protein